MGASAGRSVGILEPVALALGLDDPTAMREPVERPFGEAFGAQYLGPAIWNWHMFALEDQARRMGRRRRTSPPFLRVLRWPAGDLCLSLPDRGRMAVAFCCCHGVVRRDKFF